MSAAAVTSAQSLLSATTATVVTNVFAFLATRATATTVSEFRMWFRSRVHDLTFVHNKDPSLSTQLKPTINAEIVQSTLSAKTAAVSVVVDSLATVWTAE